MAQVLTRPLSPQSLLQPRVQSGDFLDCYAVRSDMPARAAADIITQFPAWVQSLMTLRNSLVRPFGLMTEGPGPGPKIGPFPITRKADNEVVAGFDDRHLDFRVSIRAENGLVSLATWVHPHNLAGRAYLTTILPFHVLIVRNALSRVANAG